MSGSAPTRVMTFAELAEGWIFCTSALLQYRYERCRTLAETPDQQVIVARMETAWLERIEEEKRVMAAVGQKTPMHDMVLQIGHKGRYAGPLIYERFQVMESLTPIGTYYLCDHLRAPDLLHRDRPGGEIVRFDTIDAAKERAAQLAGSTTEPAIQAKPWQRNPPLGSQKEGVTNVAKKTTPTPAPAKAKTVNGGGEKKPSAGARFRELIAAGKLTDDQIFATVQKEFGLSDDKKSYVKWYRNDMTKKGLNPPGPVGGVAAPALSPSERAKAMQAGKKAKAELKAKAAAAAAAAAEAAKAAKSDARKAKRAAA